MTYAQFISASQRAQRAYIDREQRRMAKAKKLWLRYADRMRKLGLHALSDWGIQNRCRELDSMLAAIDDTHGDTPGMRAVYAMRQAEYGEPREPESGEAEDCEKHCC